MFGNFILLIILLSITFCISIELGIFTLLLLAIILPIAKFFRNLELKKQGRNIAKVEYYADKEYQKLLDKENNNYNPNKKY
ncbi:MAG: hypothetical protein IJO43_02195 [Bacilli bacterium]|nr:hypothetical protein [Bacilli bacterium]